MLTDLALFRHIRLRPPGGVVQPVGLLRHQFTKSESGTTILEVLLAVAILISAAIPMIDLGRIVRGAAAYERQLAAVVASNKIEELFKLPYRETVASWPDGYRDPKAHHTEDKEIGPYTFTIQWRVPDLPKPPGDPFDYTGRIKQVNMLVTCSAGCRTPVEVRMVATLAKGK